MVDEKVLLKVSMMKGITRLEKKGKLSRRFVGPFDVLRRVGEVSYELASPPRLSGVNPIFHVSMLCKYHADRSHVLDYSTVQLDESLGYEEEPVAIVDRQLRISWLRLGSSSGVKEPVNGLESEVHLWAYLTEALGAIAMYHGFCFVTPPPRLDEPSIEPSV
ncbi:uncharacterized protein [Nicotiana tomentosiformis]|uniref:uncharacterized protein n=1 Tax=Nicotiana tomentosiformis TaxID=4098 RepID=UPI00388C341E